MFKEIYDFIDKEIRINYKTRAEAARHIGISKESLHTFMRNLKTEQGITVKTLYKLINGLGYKIVFKKKEN